jgi:hypothetical protein
MPALRSSPAVASNSNEPNRMPCEMGGGEGTDYQLAPITVDSISFETGKQ